MAGALSFRVTGLRELLRVTDQLPKHIKQEVRKELRAVAEPVRDEAQQRFLREISSDPQKSRYGISVRRTGSITVEQRVRSKTGQRQLKRPKFVDLQFEEALDPALLNNEDVVLAGFNRVLDSLERRWAVG